MDNHSSPPPRLLLVASVTQVSLLSLGWKREEATYEGYSFLKPPWYIHRQKEVCLFVWFEFTFIFSFIVFYFFCACAYRHILWLLKKECKKERQVRKKKKRGGGGKQTKNRKNRHATRSFLTVLLLGFFDESHAPSLWKEGRKTTTVGFCSVVFHYLSIAFCLHVVVTGWRVWRCVRHEGVDCHRLVCVGQETTLT